MGGGEYKIINIIVVIAIIIIFGGVISLTFWPSWDRQRFQGRWQWRRVAAPPPHRSCTSSPLQPFRSSASRPAPLPWASPRCCYFGRRTARRGWTPTKAAAAGVPRRQCRRRTWKSAGPRRVGRNRLDIPRETASQGRQWSRWRIAGEPPAGWRRSRETRRPRRVGREWRRRRWWWWWMRLWGWSWPLWAPFGEEKMANFGVWLVFWEVTVPLPMYVWPQI